MSKKIKRGRFIKKSDEENVNEYVKTLKAIIIWSDCVSFKK